MVSLLSNRSPTLKPVILDITLSFAHFLRNKKVKSCFVCGNSRVPLQCAKFFPFLRSYPTVNLILRKMASTAKGNKLIPKSESQSLAELLRAVF